MNYNRFLLFILSLLSIGLFSKCVSYGNTTVSQYTPIKNTPCNQPPSNFYLFFEGESLDFKYEKVGLVETDGEEYAKTEDMINNLSYKAWNNCANGLINIKHEIREREKGRTFDSTSTEIYNSQHYSAVAINIDTDSTFLAKHGSGIDTTFVQNVKAYNNQVSKDDTQELTASFLGGLLGVVLIIVALIKSS